MKMRHIAASLALGAVTLYSAQTLAMFGDDEARKAILELREQVRIQKDAQLQLAGQIEELREQNAQLTGKVERLSNELVIQQRAARELFTNLDNRMLGLEAQSVSVDGVSLTVSAEERRRYELALRYLADGEYALSRDLLERLTVDYPESAYMPFALYWLGFDYFALDQYQKTITVQKRVIERFPKSPRLADAMLSLGTAQAALGKKNEAAKTFAAIVKQFPDSEVAKTAKERRKTLK